MDSEWMGVKCICNKYVGLWIQGWLVDELMGGE